MVHNKFLILFPSSDKVIRYCVKDFAIYFGLRTEVSAYSFNRAPNAYIVNGASDPNVLPECV